MVLLMDSGKIVCPKLLTGKGQLFLTNLTQNGIPLIAKVLQKVQREEATLMLIAPWWPKRPWFPTLVSLLIRPPVILPDRKDLLRQPGTMTYHPKLSSLKLTLWIISGQSQYRQVFLTGLPVCPQSSSDLPQGALMTLDCNTSSTGVAITRLIQPQLL